MPPGKNAPLSATSAIDPSQTGDRRASPIATKAMLTAGVNRSGHRSRSLASSTRLPKPCLLRFVFVNAVSIGFVIGLLSRCARRWPLCCDDSRWQLRGPMRRFRWRGVKGAVRTGRTAHRHPDLSLTTLAETHDLRVAGPTTLPVPLREAEAECKRTSTRRPQYRRRFACTTGTITGAETGGGWRS